LEFIILELFWAYSKAKFKENNIDNILQPISKTINMFFISNY
jgi:hypothetical protein